MSKEEKSPEVLAALKKYVDLTDPFAAITVKAIDDMMQYINNNKEEIKAAIVELAKADPSAQDIAESIEDGDVKLLAAADSLFGLATNRFESMTMMMTIVGKMSAGWDAFYEKYATAKTTAAANEAKRKEEGNKPVA